MTAPGTPQVDARALVTQGTQVPDGSVAFGSPARVVRPCTPSDIEANRRNAAHYVALCRERLS